MVLPMWRTTRTTTSENEVVPHMPFLALEARAMYRETPENEVLRQVPLLASPASHLRQARDVKRFPVVIAKFWAVRSACENKPGGVSQIVIAVTV